MVAHKFASHLARGVLLLIPTMALSARLGNDLYFRTFGPKGNLMIKKVDLRWECWSDEPKAIERVEAELNGQILSCKYDFANREVIAPAATLLEPGDYHASIRVYYGRGAVHSKEWNFQVDARAIGDLPQPTLDQKRALEVTNSVRKLVGLPAAAMDSRLNAAGQAHARYLTANGASGHFEKEGSLNFIGKSPQERLEAFGFIGGAFENVAVGAGTLAEKVKQLMDAPYHRIPFLQPGAMSFGAGADGRVLTMECAQTELELTSFYPFANQKDVPCKWEGPEHPDPLAIHQLQGQVVGYPIVICHFAPNEGKLLLKDASLTCDSGSVPCVFNSCANDPNLKQAVFLIPKKPLEPKTTYAVRFSGSFETPDKVIPIENQWLFTTAGE